MALTFNDSSQQVDHGSDASLDDMVPITILMWVYPTTIDTTYRRAIAKGGSGLMELAFTDEFDIGVPNNFQFGRGYSTTGAFSRAAQDTITVNKWQCIAVTFAALVAPKLYHGDLDTIITETAYALEIAKSGTLVTDASLSLRIGRREDATDTFLGRIAFVGMWKRELTLGQLQAQQFHPHVTADCKLFTHYGFNGTGTQADWSGNTNNGTVTGASQADHVPLGPAFGFDQPGGIVPFSGDIPWLDFKNPAVSPIQVVSY